MIMYILRNLKRLHYKYTGKIILIIKINIFISLKRQYFFKKLMSILINHFCITSNIHIPIFRKIIKKIYSLFLRNDLLNFRLFI